MTPQRRSIEGGADGLTYGHAKRDRSWDAEHNYQVASYRIDAELKQAIKDIADKLKGSTADIAGIFLQYGLDAYQAGDLKLSAEPKEYEIKAKKS
jgi:hypothetical protein